MPERMRRARYARSSGIRQGVCAENAGFEDR